MKKGHKDIKGEFWVGQRVRFDTDSLKLKIPKTDFLCDTGVITKILGKFLRTPSMARLTYKVRFDKGMLKYPIFQQIEYLSVDGKHLTSIEKPRLQMAKVDICPNDSKKIHFWEQVGAETTKENRLIKVLYRCTQCRAGMIEIVDVIKFKK